MAHAPVDSQAFHDQSTFGPAVDPAAARRSPDRKGLPSVTPFDCQLGPLESVRERVVPSADRPVEPAVCPFARPSVLRVRRSRAR